MSKWDTSGSGDMPPASKTAPLLARLREPATIYADKVAVLDARDKLIRTKIRRVTDVNKAVTKIGTCQEMCPERERYFRIDTNQVSAFEKDPITGYVDMHRMVKEYRRAGADQAEPLPSELRPPAVLRSTMEYLCCTIMDRTSDSEEDWFDFLWSRTRAIRKDITQQELNDLTAVQLMEQIARFHIFSSHRLCELPPNAFDPKINRENLSKSIQSLKHFYEDLARHGVSTPNEAEFRCYDILMNLNDPDVMREVKQYRDDIRRSPPVREAVELFLAFNHRNYIKFIILFRKTSFLNGCLLHQYLTKVRMDAFKVLRRAFVVGKGSELYPVGNVLQQLGFDDESDLEGFCKNIGVQIDSSSSSVILVRGPTLEIERLPPKRSRVLVLDKLHSPASQLIYGGPLPESPCRTMPVTDSFTGEGRLKFDLNELDSNLLNEDSTGPNVAEVPPPQVPITLTSAHDPTPAYNFFSKITRNEKQQLINEAQPQFSFTTAFKSIVSQEQAPVHSDLSNSAAAVPHIPHEAVQSSEEDIDKLVAKNMEKELLESQRQARERQLDAATFLIGDALLENVIRHEMKHLLLFYHKIRVAHLKQRATRLIYRELMSETITSLIRHIISDHIRRQKMAHHSAVQSFIINRKKRLLRKCVSIWRAKVETKRILLSRRLRQERTALILSEYIIGSFVEEQVVIISDRTLAAYLNWYISLAPKHIYIHILRGVVADMVTAIGEDTLSSQRNSHLELIAQVKALRTRMLVRRCVRIWRVRVAERRASVTFRPAAPSLRPRITHQLTPDLIGLPIRQKSVSQLLSEFKEEDANSSGPADTHLSNGEAGLRRTSSSSSLIHLNGRRRSSMASCFELDPLPLPAMPAPSPILLTRSSSDLNLDSNYSSTLTYSSPPISLSGIGDDNYVFKIPNSRMPTSTLKRKISCNSTPSPRLLEAPRAKMMRSFSDAVKDAHSITQQLERSASLNDLSTEEDQSSAIGTSQLDAMSSEIDNNLNTSARLERLRQSIEREVEMNSSFSSSLEMLVDFM